MQLKDKRILILGLGESGLAMARWCVRQGARVRVADTREAPPGLAGLHDVEFVSGEFGMDLLEDIALLALSPGLPGNLPLVLEALRRGIPVTGEIELFAQGLRKLGWRDGARIIAITGTNGKTSTTALVGHLCRAAGKATEVAGNISPAALAALMACQDAGRRPEAWVLELSSFQLETMESLDADAATVLNVSEDHLDRYGCLDEYVAAKVRIFRGARVQVINRQDARTVKMARPECRRLSFGLDAPVSGDDFGLREKSGEPWLARGELPLMPLSELPLSGLHNAANALAALALCEAIGLRAESLLPALRDFRGLAHRMQCIVELDGVAWYDDSKGTNVGATVAALEGLQRKVVLIVGGDGKGQDFSPLKAACERHARAVVLIGRDGPRIGAALSGIAASLLPAATLEQAVEIAAQQARTGDAVLLSPACASFDMFRDYRHRAEVFAAAVGTLQERAV